MNVYSCSVSLSFMIYSFYSLVRHYSLVCYYVPRHVYIFITHRWPIYLLIFLQINYRGPSGVVEVYFDGYLQ